MRHRTLQPAQGRMCVGEPGVVTPAIRNCAGRRRRDQRVDVGISRRGHQKWLSVDGDLVPTHGYPPRLIRKLIECRYLRSEEHTSELQSLMRISYAVFCLKKKK